MGNNEVEIGIIGGDISIRRYRDKEKNDALLGILRELIDKQEFEGVENWVRALEGTYSEANTCGIDNDMIYCG